MNPILATILGLLFLASSAFGWILEKPVDYKSQLNSADFVGIVEVTKVSATGGKKVLDEDGVAFRELRIELRVLSAMKGNAEIVTCSIYREPTREELIADGVAENQVSRVLLNLGTSEELHLFPARVSLKDRLLVYLKSSGESFAPVSGDLESSRSFLKIEPSNIVNNLTRKKQAKEGVAVNSLHAE